MSRTSIGVAFLVTILILSTQPLSETVELNDSRGYETGALPGNYTDSNSYAGQSPCPPGTYQPTAGQSNCLDASPGHYVSDNSWTEMLLDGDRTISAGSDYSCVVLSNGSISCWGRNAYGQLGDGTTEDRFTPAQTASLGEGRFPITVDTNRYSSYGHTCALIDDGSVSCWGANGWGQLGDGTTENRFTPARTASLGPFRSAVAISVGGLTSCAILDNGSVSCWGIGNLGTGMNGGSTTPTPTASLPGGLSAVDISSGADHTCVILEDGSVSCWGNGNNGQLGFGDQNNGWVDGAYSKKTPTPTASLPGGLSAVDISSGRYHTCVILEDGSASCWGSNSQGQIGDTGPSVIRPTPVHLQKNLFKPGSGTNSAVAISAGSSHTCAILDDGSVSCWGDNTAGQLGDGTTYDRNRPTPTASLGIGRSAVAISAGSTHTCAILDDGSVSCWGKNYDLTPSQSNPRLTGLGPGAASTSILHSHTGQMAQIPCGPGQYQPSIGQTTCLSSDPGHYVATIGQSTQTPCALGTYMPFSGYDHCIIAEFNFYVDEPAATSQTPCPDDRDAIPQAGSTTLLDCYIDTDSDGTPDISDTDDDNDGVLDGSDLCDGGDDALDLDYDGIPDDCDSIIDSDFDGVADEEDRCNGYDDSVDLDKDFVIDGCDSWILSDSSQSDLLGKAGFSILILAIVFLGTQKRKYLD